jgi:hypothetical protein
MPEKVENKLKGIDLRIAISYVTYKDDTKPTYWLYINEVYIGQWTYYEAVLETLRKRFNEDKMP